MGICSSCETEPSHCHRPVRSCYNKFPNDIFQNDTCGNQAEYYYPPSQSYQQSYQNYQETNRVPINPYFSNNRIYYNR